MAFPIYKTQVNALIMQPGSYRTTDYAGAEAGMMLLFPAVLMGMLHLPY